MILLGMMGDSSGKDNDSSLLLPRRPERKGDIEKLRRRVRGSGVLAALKKVRLEEALH